VDATATDDLQGLQAAQRGTSRHRSRRTSAVHVPQGTYQ
jgi:hypothetical protein